MLVRFFNKTEYYQLFDWRSRVALGDTPDLLASRRARNVTLLVSNVLILFCIGIRLLALICLHLRQLVRKEIKNFQIFSAT